MGRKKSIHYVDKQELLKELKRYKKKKEISEKLGEMMLKIANRLTLRYNFFGYTYKDEFVYEAVYRMVEQLDKINVDHPKSNPFCYLTQICYNCFVAKINKEKKYQSLKEELKTRCFDGLEQDEGITFRKNSESENDDSD